MISFKDSNVSVISVYRGYVRNRSNGQSCFVEQRKARFNKCSSGLNLSNSVIGYFVADCFAEMRAIVAGGCMECIVLVLMMGGDLI